ncbi:MAG: extracellular solute-binding protein [Lactobacillus sp.]|nr:extracellular solute-binding protein [Lactobacillus sp.]
MTKNKKKLTFISIILLLLIAVCGYFAKVSNEPKTLTIGIYTGSYWDVPQGDSYHMIDYVVKQFKKTHPNVRVVYESGITKTNYRSWLADRLVKGNEPDIFIIPDHSFNILASDGALFDLSSYIKNDHYPLQNFYSAAIKSGTYGGKQLAMPFEVNPSLMVVNTSLLEKNKLKKPAFNWKPTELELLNKKLRQKGYYGITQNFDWQAAVRSYQGEIFSVDGTKTQLTSNKVMKGLDLINEITQLNNNDTVTTEMFDQGQVAFSPMSLAKYRTYTSYPYHVTRSSKFKWDVIKTPSMSKKTGTKLANVSFGISAHSPHKDLAWKFMKVLLSKKTQTELIQYSQGISPLKKVAQSKAMQKALLKEGNTLDTKKLNAILNSGMDYPKFKKYYAVKDDADYQIEKGLKSGKLETEVYEIQSYLDEELK